MRKLLIATDGFLPRWDGISSFMHEVLPRIDDKYDITVLAPNLGRLKKHYRVKLHRFKTLKIRLGDNYYPSLVNPIKVFNEVKRSELVWVQALAPIGISSMIAAKLTGKKLFLYNHMFEWEVYPNSQKKNIFQVPINVLTKIVAKIFYNMCSTIIVPSIEQAEILNLMGIRNHKEVVPLGVDVVQYSPPKDKNRYKSRIKIPKDRYVIGYGGRVSYEKDLKTLYRAFLRLHRKYKDCFLLIAGGGRPEIENMFKKNPNVLITGLQDNLAPYYKAMDVYVLPSLTETSSLTTMEAMATEVPVVATPVGYVKEYIDEGNNGLLFPKKNSYELYRILEYLKANPKEALELAKRGRKTIVNHYSWEKTAEKLVKVIK